MLRAVVASAILASCCAVAHAGKVRVNGFQSSVFDITYWPGPTHQTAQDIAGRITAEWDYETGEGLVERWELYDLDFTTKIWESEPVTFTLSRARPFHRYERWWEGEIQFAAEGVTYDATAHIWSQFLLDGSLRRTEIIVEPHDDIRIRGMVLPDQPSITSFRIYGLSATYSIPEPSALMLAVLACIGASAHCVSKRA